MDVVIVDLSYSNILRVSSMTMHAMTVVIQEETQSYIKDDFIPLAIETSHFDFFFISYAQTTRTHHQWSFLVPMMLISCYQQCVSIAL